jgi:hypothetical protein
VPLREPATGGLRAPGADGIGPGAVRDRTDLRQRASRNLRSMQSRTSLRIIEVQRRDLSSTSAAALWQWSEEMPPWRRSDGDVAFY